MARRIISGSKNTLLKKAQGFLEHTFLHKKLNNWFGLFFIAAVAAGFGFLLARNMIFGLGLLGLLFGLFMAIICISSPETGLYITTAYSFLAFFLSRRFFNEQLPVGAIFSGLVLATFIGLIIKKDDFRKNFNHFVKNTFVLAYFLTIIFQAIEFFNPNSMSMETNILGLRNYLGYIFTMFIAYSVFTSYEKIKKFIFFLFFVSTATAIYGCVQQWHGYFNFELKLILADRHAFGLLFVGGELRKYSTMSDPSTFGILMAVCTVFFIILTIHEKNIRNKAIFLTGIFFMILAMGYSGTRTAYATAIGGLAFYILLNFDKSDTRRFGIIAFVVFLVLLYGPFGNRTIARFRTTFIGTKDESYKVRVLSRKFIQPYILSHPLGGGVGATSSKNQSGHYLAEFQPDSSYVRRAAETGWIGLGIICILYFICLRTGIKKFFRANQEKNRIFYGACVSGLFGFYIAEFAQGAIGGIADSVVYYPILAIILKLKFYDTETGNQNL